MNKRCIFALFMLHISMFTQDAYAARRFSVSIIYFDVHNNIIGQQAAFCNNVTMHGGVIDTNNPYRITIEGGCGNNIVRCDNVSITQQEAYVCKRVGNEYSVMVTYYRSSTNTPIDEVCSTLVFCESIEPDLAYGWGFDFTRGFQ